MNPVELALAQAGIPPEQFDKFSMLVEKENTAFFAGGEVKELQASIAEITADYPALPVIFWTASEERK